jgi:pyruvate kinase
LDTAIQLHELPKTKIIATVGPSSWEDGVLRNMIDNGMTVARINASFADREELERVSDQMRRISPDTALMLDTKGHKVRLSDFGNDITIEDGQTISLATGATDTGLYLVVEEEVHLEDQIVPGTIVLIDDGAIKLRVEKTEGGKLICLVLQGGQLKRRKTVSFLGETIDLGGLSQKDVGDIQTAKELEFDFIAASYVRNAGDVNAVRSILEKSEIGIIAKIEDENGVTHFDEILESADGIMIARGDLAIGVPMEKVPVYQKIFIKKCNEMGKPVIVATQMLESMTKNLLPTRAEVNDVANAIYDGADAVMLSAETATGEHPNEAVATMVKIAKEIEKVVEPVECGPSPLAKPTTNAIAQAVIDASASIPVDKIIVATQSGTTARTIARFRPHQPIFAFAADVRSKRKLSMSRGIFSDVLNGESSSRDSGVQSLVRTARNRGYVQDHDLVIVIAGSNILGTSGTNMLEIDTVSNILS